MTLDMKGKNNLMHVNEIVWPLAGIATQGGGIKAAGLFSYLRLGFVNQYHDKTVIWDLVSALITQPTL